MLTRKPIITGVVAAALAVAATGIATAEPARTIKLGGATTSATWESSGSGVTAVQDTADDEVYCQPGVYDCDDTLIEITEAGTLTVKTTGGGANTPGDDIDLSLHTATASGESKDEIQLSAQDEPTPDEQVSARVKPGFYIARIEYMICAQCPIAAEATFKSGGAPVTPSGDNPPTVTAKKPKSKNVKSFKGTAADDKGIAKVEFALQQAKGATCKDVSTSAKLKSGSCNTPSTWIAAKGTTTWSGKIKKKLKKGSYVLYARATDSAGQTVTNRTSFKVKK